MRFGGTDYFLRKTDIYQLLVLFWPTGMNEPFVVSIVILTLFLHYSYMYNLSSTVQKCITIPIPDTHTVWSDAMWVHVELSPQCIMVYYAIWYIIYYNNYNICIYIDIYIYNIYIVLQSRSTSKVWLEIAIMFVQRVTDLISVTFWKTYFLCFSCLSTSSWNAGNPCR